MTLAMAVAIAATEHTQEGNIEITGFRHLDSYAIDLCQGHKA